MQSRVLVVFAAAGLAVGTVRLTWSVIHTHQNLSSFFLLACLSWTFGLMVWALRAGTPAAALWGSVICLLVSWTSQVAQSLILHSALIPLATLFLLTFLATRLGRARKQNLGLAEPHRGRNAAQVVANLGAAGLIAAAALLQPALTGGTIALLILAALAEATADTLSSEIGQAFGGTPRLLTRWQAVPPGTDGAVTLLGTLAGIAGAAIVVLTGVLTLHLSARTASITLVAALTGLFFDSFLGATIERRGWLNNDLVNFSSTLAAVLTAALLLHFFQARPPRPGPTRPVSRPASGAAASVQGAGAAPCSSAPRARTWRTDRTG